MIVITGKSLDRATEACCTRCGHSSLNEGIFFVPEELVANAGGMTVFLESLAKSLRGDMEEIRAAEQPVGYLGQTWHCSDCEAAAKIRDAKLKRDELFDINNEH